MRMGGAFLRGGRKKRKKDEKKGCPVRIIGQVVVI